MSTAVCTMARLVESEKKLHPLVSLLLFHHCALSIKFYKKKKKRGDIVGETRMRTNQMTNSNER